MIPRAVRDWVCVLGALALAVGVAGCGGPGVGVASPSPTPTFLAQETMCEVVPSRILVEEMSFRTTDYAFEHHTSTGENGANTDTFICNLNGRQNSLPIISRIRIAYWPGATLNASSPYPFSDLDNEPPNNDLQPISFDDVEHGKPHPQGYLLGARRLGVEPARTAGVEDSAPGLAAARAAGTLVVAVGGSRDGDVVCHDLHELRRLLIAAADRLP